MLTNATARRHHASREQPSADGIGLLRWARRFAVILIVATGLTPRTVAAQQQPVDYEAVRNLIYIDQQAQAGNTDAAEDLVRLTFPEDPDTAVRIARRESGLRCGARNPTSSASGIMQIMGLHAPRAARMGVQWQEVQTSCLANLAVARALYNESKWQPWRLTV